MNDSALPFVEVDALRIGMFIHLDLGWMSHPFPLSSFRIASDEQIQTLCGLGLQRVRWCPQRSDVHAAPPQPAPQAAESPQAARRLKLQAAAAAQRAALHQCERKFAEAAKALRAATDLVPSRPQQAAERARALTRTVIDDMLAAREVNIRLLSPAAGDRSAAHAVNVAIVSLLMGRNFGLGDDELMDLGVGAMLHDIGKIDLPDWLRWRDSDWAPAELGRWRDHVALGLEHGRKMGLGAGALLVIAQHHEQADGTGFPLKLNLDRMSAAARIVALVDRFDTLCNPAQAARTLTPHEALSTMFAQSQHQFDSTMLSAFIRMMGVYPPGSVVQLTDDRYALVVSVNSTRPLKPRVLVHDLSEPDDDAPLLDLETTPGLGIRRSLKPAQLPRAALQQLSPRPRALYGFEPVAEPA